MVVCITLRYVQSFYFILPSKRLRNWGLAAKLKNAGQNPSTQRTKHLATTGHGSPATIKECLAAVFQGLIPIVILRVCKRETVLEFFYVHAFRQFHYSGEDSAGKIGLVLVRPARDVYGELRVT
jgi:hypothetical protein